MPSTSPQSPVIEQLRESSPTLVALISLHEWTSVSPAPVVRQVIPSSGSLSQVKRSIELKEGEE